MGGAEHVVFAGRPEQVKVTLAAKVEDPTAVTVTVKVVDSPERTAAGVVRLVKVKTALMT
jgi:hypothetical protein